MKRLFLFTLLLIVTLIIANIGPWIEYPNYQYNLLLVFSVYKELFPQISSLVFISTTVALLIFGFGGKLIFITLYQTKSTLGNNDNLNIFQKIFGSTKEINKYGYAFLINTLPLLKKYLARLELNFSKGMLLGKMGNKFIRSNQSYSCLVLAPPGTGKTAGIVIPNLLLCDNSMLIHDPKGELYDITHKAREKHLGHKTFLFDVSDPNSAKFNVFHKSVLPKDKDDIKAYILNIANIIYNQDKVGSNNNDNYFVNTAKAAFTFFAHYLICKNGETSIPEIRKKLLEDSDVVETIESMIEEDIPESLKIDGRGVLIDAGGDSQWSGVLGQLKGGLELFSDPRIERITSSTCDFTGDKLRQEKLSVYLKIRDKDRKRLQPLISMLIEAVSTQLISQMPEDSDKNVTFILDEFVRLSKMEAIADLPAISRGYKLSSIFVAQDYKQISNTYGQDYVEIFETNCAYKIIFRQNNFFTAEKISKLIGNKTVSKTSTSKNQSNRHELKISFQGNSGKSESQSSEGIALITPQDILGLSSNNCIIIAQGHASKPILAKNPMWFKEKDLKKLIN